MSDSPSRPFDVIVVGFGPAGEVLASTLGAAGLSVAVVERWPRPYPLPRLTTLDGECCRVVQATALNVDRGFEESTVQDACHFVNAEGEPLMVVRYPGQLGGWPARLNIFQPDFEQVIADKVETMANVQVNRGWEATALRQSGECVDLDIAQIDDAAQEFTGEKRTLSAQYLVGTDGARSFVRAALNIQVRDFQLHERWLNFDAELKRPLPEHLMKKLIIYMDPARPHMHMPIGTKRLRLEFRVMENETDEECTRPQAAWDFLTRQHNLGPDDIRIMRQVVYHYHTRITTQWRIGRVFLAGDAAHTMPPYMGQGGCAAIRDARNLGWKLIEVLSGRSRSSLLDEYGAEREPHVTTIVMGSDKLSRIVNIVDPAAAAARDAGMKKQGVGHPPELPKLTTGVIHRGANGSASVATGEYSPQGLLERQGVRKRGDEFVGDRFQLWCLKDPSSSLGAAERSWLERIGCGIAVFDDPASQYAYRDVEGVYRRYLADRKADFVIVRPDFYVFGADRIEKLNAFVRELSDRLYSTEPLQ